MNCQSKFNILSVHSVNLGLQDELLQLLQRLESLVNWEAPASLYAFIVVSDLMHSLKQGIRLLKFVAYLCN